jgi:hypothetical protein
MARATGDSAKQIGPNRHAANTNTTDETRMKTTASARDIAPRISARPSGIEGVVDASASRLNSWRRRAATIATTIQTTRQATTDGFHSPIRFSARSAPVNANGSAKTEWLKRTKLA